jgi:hypothetical protein
MGLNDILKAGKAGAAAAAKSLNGDGEPGLTEVNDLVAQFAEAWWAEKDAKAKKDKLREKILKLHKASGVDSLEGDEGEIKIIRKKDSIGFIAKAAKELLTEEQIKQCTGVTRKGGINVEFVPATKRPGE